MFDAYEEWGRDILVRVQLEDELETGIERALANILIKRGARAKRLQCRHGSDSPRGKFLATRIAEAREKRRCEQLLDKEMHAEAADFMAGVYDPNLRDGFGDLWGDFQTDSDFYPSGEVNNTPLFGESEPLDSWDEPLEEQDFIAYIEAFDFLLTKLPI